jgi:3-(3-hydroxy-phenyl)propionate hydroxylase
VFAVFDRSGDTSRHGHPRANMFDQPELEHLLRANLKNQTTVTLRGNVEVTDIAQDGQGRVQVDFTDGLTGQDESVLATYVLGCDGANSVVRTAIGSAMQDLNFEQRWLVIDVACTVELDQWEGVHQVCDPDRAATYMRIGPNRYRWEFRLLTGETAADFSSVERCGRCFGRGFRTSRTTTSSSCGSRNTPSERRSPTAGATATCSSSVTRPT